MIILIILHISLCLMFIGAFFYRAWMKIKLNYIEREAYKKDFIQLQWAVANIRSKLML